ncbi:hypothetical protein NW752_000163 [Fusarium irregulare]|uniref:Uncharacterized protein n=1 Tax=Fusarium irregulare TaxID=2494466 RepID=A0A9W8PYP0_9HYPO|nr:hypothetical protein NW766_001672 [Fusarium irregulare]KAJ4027914.1 hypothetical protein NW752_000163 [Fusarium irregulare]
MAITRWRLETTLEKESAHMEFPEADIVLYSAKQWGDLTAGEGGRFGRLSDALMKDATVNKKCRDLITMDGKHRFEDSPINDLTLRLGT